MSRGGQSPTPARERIVRRVRRLGTVAVGSLLVGLVVVLAASTATILLVAHDDLRRDTSLTPVLVPSALTYLVALAGALTGATHLARWAARTVQRLFDHQDRLMLAVAHELRIPLSRAVVALDEGSSGVLPPERAVVEARHNTNQLATLIGDLVETARVMSGAVDLSRDDIRLDELVGSAVREVPLGRVRVQLDGQPTVISGSASLLRRAVINLIHNAAVHGYGGRAGTIRIGVDGDGITVRDDGPGVPPERLHELQCATPFARRPRVGGLGLRLARWVAEIHGGRLVLRNAEGGGFEARLQLPVRLVSGTGTQR